MKDINVLPQSISDQIAAGEVVERPASVVKELVENAIDAGANHIQVHLDNGGKARIQITDNGHGMSPENAEKSLLRHATSKIHKIEDLFALSSYGFRGEALAAISSISNLTLTTRDHKSLSGTQVCINAGKNKTISEAPHNQGTTIKVEDLFVSTPARLQYLKKDETEYRYALQEVIFAALARPNVGFEVYKNGNRTIQYLTTQSEEDRIKNVLGKTAQNLLSFSAQSSIMEVRGYTSMPGECLSSRSRQYIFVNGRPVEDYRIAHAVREAYVKTCGIEKHLHPAFVLFVLIDPILVDVNVHPRKREVKFSDPQDVYSMIRHALREAIEKTAPQISIPHNTQSSSSFSTPPKFNTPRISTPSFSQQYTNRNISVQQNAPKFHNTIRKPDTLFSHTPEAAIQTENPLKLIGQVRNRYIIAEAHDGLYIFDQHALHERQRFERLYEQAMNKKVEQQKLLIPADISVTEEEWILLQEHDGEMAEIGIQCEYPQQKIVRVTSVPQLLSHLDASEFIPDMITYFQEGSIGENTAEKILRKMLEYRSCRGSVFFGDPMHAVEMQQLLNDFQSTKWKLLCPHGRPNHYFWPFDDLEKKFHR